MNLSKDEQREKLYRLLGDLPDRELPVKVQMLAEEKREGYYLEKLLLHLNGMEPVPAYFIRPNDVSGKLPAVLFNHSHGGNYALGKDELLRGNSYLQDPSYAEQLTRMGYAVLSIDAWGFGERRGRSESELFKEMLWNGQVLWGMMVYDSLRAIDYLTTRDDVDDTRLATLGMSMGSTMSWWTAALDKRIRVCVDICGLTDYQELIRTRGLDGHGIYYYVPGLLKAFTSSDINALIAPRAHLGLAGNYDKLTPSAGLDRIDAHLRQVYQEEGRPEAWKLVRCPGGHLETAEMRAEVIAFLKQWL